MAAPLTAVEATEQLGLDRTAFAELIDNGVVARRATGDAAFWPEELVLARLRSHPLVEPLPHAGPLLAFARIVAQTPDPNAAIVAAVRLAICLSDGIAAAYRALEPGADAVVCYAEGPEASDPAGLPSDPAAPLRPRLVGSHLTVTVREPVEPVSSRSDPGEAIGKPLGYLTVHWPSLSLASKRSADIQGPLTGLSDLLGIVLSRPPDHPSRVDLVELDRLTDERMWDPSGRIAASGVAVLAQRLTGTLAALVYRAAPGASLGKGTTAPLVRAATRDAAAHGWPSIALVQASDLAALLAGDTVMAPDLRTVRWPALHPDSSACLAGAPIGAPDRPVSGFLLIFGFPSGYIDRHRIELLVALGRAAARAMRSGTPESVEPDDRRSSSNESVVEVVTSALYRSTTLSDGLRILTNTAVTMARANVAGIHLYHGSGTGIRVAARWSLVREEHEELTNGSTRSDPWTFYEFAPLEADTSNTQRSLAQQAFQRAISVPRGAQIVALPLLLQGEVIGVFWLARGSDEPSFTRAEIDAFGILGLHGTAAIERGLLLDSERRQRHEATVLVRLASAVNGASSLDDLMDVVAGIAGEAVGADHVSLFVYDAAQTSTVGMGHFIAKPGAGFQREPGRPNDPLSPMEVPAEAEVIRTRQPLVRDAQSPFLFTPFGSDWRSDVVVPLVAENSVQGVMYLDEHTRDRLFGPEDLTLLQAIGQHAGFAVLRVRDAEVTARRAEYLAALNALGRALSGTLDIDALCAILRDHLQRMVPLDAFAVALSTGDVADSAVVYADDDIRALFADRALPAASPETLVVPMVSNGAAIGVIAARRGGHHAYHAEDERTLETVAQLAAASFASARLFAESAAARDVAEGYAEDIQSVLNVTHAVASAPDLATMLEVLTDELGSLIPHHECIVFQLSADGNSLDATHYRRDGISVVLADPSIPSSAGHCGIALATGLPALINNAHLDPLSAYNAHQLEEIRTRGEHVMVAPLVVAGQSIGVIFLNRPGLDSPFSTPSSPSSASSRNKPPPPCAARPWLRRRPWPRSAALATPRIWKPSSPLPGRLPPRSTCPTRLRRLPITCNGSCRTTASMSGCAVATKGFFGRSLPGARAGRIRLPPRCRTQTRASVAWQSPMPASS